MFVYKNCFKMKEWFYNKMNADAKSYYMRVNCDQNEDYSNVIEDNCVFVTGNIIAETEKAYKVEFCTSSDNNKDWTAWVPKSVVAEIKNLEEFCA